MKIVSLLAVIPLSAVDNVTRDKLVELLPLGGNKEWPTGTTIELWYIDTTFLQ